MKSIYYSYEFRSACVVRTRSERESQPHVNARKLTHATYTWCATPQYQFTNDRNVVKARVKRGRLVFSFFCIQEDVCWAADDLLLFYC